jgi:hypothetical protein
MCQCADLPIGFRQEEFAFHSLNQSHVKGIETKS